MFRLEALHLGSLSLNSLRLGNLRLKDLRFQNLRLKSLRLKLIACFLALSLLPLVATTLYGHFFTRSALSEQALERSTYQVDLQVESIAASLRQVQNDVAYISSIRSLNMLRQQTASDGVTLWKHEVASDLLVLASVRTMYHSIRLLDEDGDELVGVEAKDNFVSILTDLGNRRDEPYFRETMRLARAGVFVSPFQRNAESGVPYIHYAVRLPDGVLVIDLHAGWLLRSLPEHPGADTWALIDQDGRFLVYPEGFHPATISEDVPHLLTGAGGRYETPTSVYVFDVIYPSEPSLTAPSDASSTVLSSQTARAATENLYWVIFRRTPTPVLYADLNDFYRLGFIFIVASALVAIWLAAGTSQWLTIPIRRLQSMAIQFGQSGTIAETPQRLPDDEVGALTRTFIDMAGELEAKRRREHRLLENLINAQEEERKLVAYDLHDGLIQQMVGARFYLTNCRDVCPIPAADARGSIQRGCDALTQAIIEGRRIIEGLRPAALDDLGLRAAIEEIAQGAATESGWTLTLDLQDLPAEPEKTVSVTLFRIAQEALNNIRKHSEAKHVWVTLHNGDGIYLSIADDGKGFDQDSISQDGRGVGITAMQERASLLQGACKITSQRGSGTKIDVHIPWSLSKRTGQEKQEKP